MTLSKVARVALAGMALAGAVGFLCWRVLPLLEERPGPRPVRPTVPIDQKIEPVGVVDLDGRPTSLQDLVAAGAGKPLVLAFWSIT